MTTPPTTLPRRANTIRRLAASLAVRKLNEVRSRQEITDRIGYAVAALLGAGAYAYGGSLAVKGVLVWYGVSALFAYRRYRKQVEASA